jgi:hypothetical protein
MKTKKLKGVVVVKKIRKKKPAKPVVEIVVHDPTLLERLLAWLKKELG